MTKQEIVSIFEQALQGKPLIYVCIEVERALGLEDLIPNLHIICYENSPIIDQLLAKDIPVYSVVRENTQHEIRKSSSAILSSDWGKQLINKISQGQEFYLQTFHPTKPFYYQASQYDKAIILNNDPGQFAQWEDKLQLPALVSEQIQVPQFKLGTMIANNYAAISASLQSSKIVIQTHNSHTGEGTYIIGSDIEWMELAKKLGRQSVKFSRFLSGDTWTINGCIVGDQVLVHGLSYQFTGIPELTSLATSTIGNDWSYAQTLPTTIIEKIFTITQKLGELLAKQNYRGLFGVDVLIDTVGNAWLLEVNARQTANIAMQSYLEREQSSWPLAAGHVLAFIKPEAQPQITYQQTDLRGAQLLNRAKSDLATTAAVTTGKYRLQSDNSAIDWHTLERKDNVIYLDEEQDKPLIFRGEAYNINQCSDAEFIILAGSPDSYQFNSELCRLQIKQGLINNGTISYWAIEALQAVANRLI